MDKLQIEIAADSQELARRLVSLFISATREAISSHEVFRTALSGGRTPERFFRQLAEEPEARSLPWDRVHVFWVDERYVASNSPASNYRLAVDTFLSRIDIPLANIHRIPTEYKDIKDAARAYERTLREVFDLRAGEVPQFDLMILGMGSDGHTASLFPKSLPAGDSGDLACAVHVANAANPNRITLTGPVLQAARRLAVVVSGGEKAQTLKEVLSSEPDEAKYPIHVLWPVLERVVWLVDRDAARFVMCP